MMPLRRRRLCTYRKAEGGAFRPPAFLGAPERPVVVGQPFPVAWPLRALEQSDPRVDVANRAEADFANSASSIFCLVVGA